MRNEASAAIILPLEYRTRRLKLNLVYDSLRNGAVIFPRAKQ
jgi:hypothetical protein